jgi:hypothetical protein
MKRTAILMILVLMASAVFAQWVSDKETDLMYGTSKIVLLSKAVIGVDTWGNTINMIIRYQDNELEIYVVWGDYIGSDDYHRVTMRFEDTEPFSSSWSLSTSGIATFYEPDPIELLKTLITKKEFYVATVPYSKGAKVAMFSMIGLREELAKYPELSGLITD